MKKWHMHGICESFGSAGIHEMMPHTSHFDDIGINVMITGSYNTDEFT